MHEADVRSNHGVRLRGLSLAFATAWAGLACVGSAPADPTDSGLGTGGLVGAGGLGSGGLGAPTDGGQASTGGQTTGIASGSTGGGSTGSGGDSPLGTGGHATSGGAGGTSSGSGGTAASTDCNDLTDQPILLVAKDGSGDHGTVQAALDSVPGSNTTPTQIRIQPGIYEEKLLVQKPHVTLCGQAGQEAATILTYADTNSTPSEGGGTLGTSGSASINISASDVFVENLTMENSHGPGIQAVALLVSGSRVEFRKVRFKGYQDTLYVKSGSQYFKDCYIEGSVDFIFGAATAVFDDCTVHSLTQGTAVVAPNTEQATPYGIVFLGGELSGEPGLTVGSIALGRNWGAYGAAAFIETELGPHISAVGWVAMGENTLSTARFAEFESRGVGANPAARAPESTQLSAGQAAEYTVANVLSPWLPSFSD